MIEKVKKQLGFGCMRLPMTGDKVDIDQFIKMVDYFMENGFNYFDTAQVYIDGQSETALKEALVQRYDREAFVLTDKLSSSRFNKKEDLEPFFNSQLENTGVSYFDFYLCHALSRGNIKKFEDCGCFEFCKKLKEEGKIKVLGMSFHDTPEVLDEILTNHPEIEVVQLQINYIDYDNPKVESYKCYRVCEKHQKKVIVMEPVKGGLLVNLPHDAKKLLDAQNNGSLASYAIRYAASFPLVFMVLSGMSNTSQMLDNISFMKDFKKLTKEEDALIEMVRSIIKTQDIIPCTSCKYCVEGCPSKIKIPTLFSVFNTKRQYNNFDNLSTYEFYTKESGKASSCIKCGKCEKICPQHLKIRDYLVEISKTYENK